MSTKSRTVWTWVTEVSTFAVFTFLVSQLSVFMLFWWDKGLLPYGNPFWSYKNDYLISAILYAPILETGVIFIVNAIVRFALPRFEAPIAVVANASIAFLFHEGYTRFPATLVFAIMTYYVIRKRDEMGGPVLFGTVCIMHSAANILTLYFSEAATSFLRLIFSGFVS